MLQATFPDFRCPELHAPIATRTREANRATELFRWLFSALEAKETLGAAGGFSVQGKAKKTPSGASEELAFPRRFRLECNSPRPNKMTRPGEVNLPNSSQLTGICAPPGHVSCHHRGLASRLNSALTRADHRERGGKTAL